MNEEQRLVQKRLRVLEHAQKTGNVGAIQGPIIGVRVSKPKTNRNSEKWWAV
jgi:hypothetical protein